MMEKILRKFDELFENSAEFYFRQIAEALEDIEKKATTSQAKKFAHLIAGKIKKIVELNHDVTRNHLLTFIMDLKLILKSLSNSLNSSAEMMTKTELELMKQKLNLVKFLNKKFNPYGRRYYPWFLEKNQNGYDIVFCKNKTQKDRPPKVGIVPKLTADKNALSATAETNGYSKDAIKNFLDQLTESEDKGFYSIKDSALVQTFYEAELKQASNTKDAIQQQTSKDKTQLALESTVTIQFKV